MDESLDFVIKRDAEFTTVKIVKGPEEKNEPARERTDQPEYSLKGKWEAGTWDWRNALNEF